MARSFGRLLSRIWDDRDFLALEPGPQRLYCFLLSQSNLNHAGLLPLTLRKWSKKAAGLTPEQIRRDLAVLDAARFVVVDEDSEELLIRSFVRNDEVYKQPRVMGSMVSGALEIESPRLRRALLAEMDRIPVDALSDEPTKVKDRPGPSIRRQVADHIEDLRKAFASRDPEPEQGRPEPPAEPLPEPPTEGVYEGVVLAPAEGGRQGSGDTRAYAGPRARALPLPLQPSPVPIPIPFGASGGGGKPPRQGPLLAIIEGGGEPADAEPPQTTEALIADWIEHVPHRPPGKVIARVGKAVKELLAEGIDPCHIRAGIAAWSRKGSDPSALPSFVNQAMNATAGVRTAAADIGDTDAWLARFVARHENRAGA